MNLSAERWRKGGGERDGEETGEMNNHEVGWGKRKEGGRKRKRKKLKHRFTVNPS